ncbi:MAG: outer membrane beta-barrel protein, partial [Candidatus Omnitrophota bacterium]
QRGLIDFLATYKPFDKWTLMVNADYGHEEDVVAAGKDGDWSGVAAYLRYDPKDWLSLISRTEFMSDRQGLRIVSGTTQDVWEQTLTLEVRPYKDLITRLEYRHDQATSPIYTDNQKASSHQDTIGLEAIYTF